MATEDKGEEWTVVLEERSSESTTNPEVGELESDCEDCESSSESDVDTTPDLGETPLSELYDTLPLKRENKTGGQLVVRITGVKRGGKSCLAESLVNMLLSRGWDLQGRESECYELMRKNGNSLVVSVDPNEELDENNLNVCLYVIPPHYVEPKTLNTIQWLTSEGSFDLVIPIICKADCMTTEEQSQYVDEVKAELSEVGVKEVLCVVGTERVYSWGIVSPTSTVSQLNLLCETLESHVQLDTTSTAQDTKKPTSPECELKACCSGEECMVWCMGLVALAVCCSCSCCQTLITNMLTDVGSGDLGFEVLAVTLILSLILVPQKELVLAVVLPVALLFAMAQMPNHETVQFKDCPKDMSMAFNACEAKLDECFSSNNNITARLYETSERLHEALELCGSWCLDV